MQRTFTEAFDLSDELVLITGGGTGLGFGMAQCLIEVGASVVIVGRRERVLQDAVSQLGDAACYRVHDVTDLAAANALTTSLERDIGPITTLINNAGHIVKHPIEETSDEEFELLLKTHVTASFALSKAVIPSMKAAKRGHILFTASMASLFGLPNVIAYAAAKSGFLGMVRSMATELSQDGIRVNAIAPGWIESELLLKTVEADPARKQRVLSRTPMGKFGQAEDIGWAAVYLCSPAANFITGACLPVDGGISIGF
ncbi:SDR family oxidoreductase [candidate division KSB3 bacterium]|uniref:SDR family oxidoreductase n=1 Tax=candidate division KSB3 bacterium TaxID=2044937 RepID=A0A9D5JVD6_9BACT|nr:SDR family oxidoreductase [candidate division KSB3 bacterium]MBD3324621.1 SDR family oxidoreductase [candidate division KSB3 bacterium]